MNSIMGAAKSAAKIGNLSGRPPAAVEITPEGVLAAALPASAAMPVYSFQQLPREAVVSSIEGVNLRNRDAVTSAIRTALDEVSPRKRAVTVVLPDALVRVFVLDFDSLPAKPVEAIPVLRFRLRKMVPFDVEKAAVSYQVLSQDKDQCRVLAAILPGTVLAEYEIAVRAAGYEPGAVLPASLAALESVDSMEAVLIANLSGQAMTTAIANGQDLLLYRTLDLSPEPELRAGEIQRGIAVAAAYYEDRLQVRPRRIHYAGNASLEKFKAWLDDKEMEVVELAPKQDILVAASVAAVAGALAVHNRQETGQ